MSDDKPKNEGNPDESGEFGGFSQDEIDALFGDSDAADGAPEASGGFASRASDPSTPSDSSTSGGDSPPDDPTGGSDAVSQADIDALFGGPADEGAEAAPAAAPDERLDTLGRPFDEVAAAMQAAMEEEAAAASAASPDGGAGASDGGTQPGPPAQPVDLPEFNEAGAGSVHQQRVTMLGDVRLRVKIELGRTRMRVEDVLTLGEGSVVELDKLAGDPVDVIVNERLVARGEVLVLNDSFCVRISEVLSNDPHRVTH